MREQDLRGDKPVLGEAGLVRLHQPHLADRGGRLQLMHGARTLPPAEPLHAFGDGAA